jgi:hypothetical protein
MEVAMRVRRAAFVVLACCLAGSLTLAQPGRGGGSPWLTPFADAQRTSWIRTDDKISVDTLSKPGFELQWKTKLDNQPRGVYGLAQGVSAAGVTLFVPMSVVAGSSNNIYGIDNDIGYVVWQRRFEGALPAPTAECPGGIASGATRIVRLDAAVPPSFGGFGRASVGYRSLVGEPSQGVPIEGRAGGGRGAAAPAAAAGARGGAPNPPGRQGGGRAAPPAERIPGTPKVEEAGGFGFLTRPSGVAYVVASDGTLHVIGLPSGKDIQKPAAFLPANSRWSAPVAVDTTLYAATTGACGGAPSGVWAIDLDSDTKPVVSWKTNGGNVVGAVAFTSDGTLIASIGAGATSGEGKANAIVALDRKTLQLKDWFTQPTAEFVTGPTIIRHGDKEVVAAATKDGRVLLLNAASLGGGDHATPLVASNALLGRDARVTADALAAWQQPSGPATSSTTSWILVPTSGTVVTLKITDAGSGLSATPGWTAQGFATPATPLIVNGVVFALATGVASSTGAKGAPAVLSAFDGATGKRLWSSEKTMTTPASPGSLWSTLGQVYVGAQDGTLYAFGFNDERRPTNDR